MPDYIARHGLTRFLGVFSASGGREYRRGARVIVRTERGLEVGDILCAAAPEAVAHLKDPGTGQILREMTPEDSNEAARIQAQAAAGNRDLPGARGPHRAEDAVG